MSRAQQQDRLEGPLPRYDSLTDLVAFAAATKVVSCIDTRKQKQTPRLEQETTEHTEWNTCSMLGAQQEQPIARDKNNNEIKEQHYITGRDRSGNLVKRAVTLETTSTLLSGLSITHIDFGVLQSLSELSGCSPKTDCRNEKQETIDREEETAVNLLRKLPMTIENLEESCTESKDSKSWNQLPYAAEKLLSTVWAPQLKEISLASNQLESIDLSPLANCVSLESLLLNSNKLKNINLSPLSSCRKLEKLWLHNNQLVTVSLEPLRDCSNLRSIYLDHNQLTQCIDLEPLKKCKLLRSLRLGSNLMKGDLDVTPLLNCSTLAVFDACSTTRLVAHFKVKTLPPALRKHEKGILWMEEQKESASNSNALKSTKVDDANWVRPRILLLGFASGQVALKNLFSNVTNLEVTGITQLCKEEATETLKNLQHFRDFDAVVCESSFDWFIPKLKMIHTDIPVIAVVSSDMTSKVASRCLRNGACCLVTAPLGPEDSLRVKEWAEKHSHSNCELRMASHTSCSDTKAATDNMEQKLVGLLKTNVPDEVNAYDLVKELSRVDIVDNLTELKAIEEIFQMNSNSVLENTYRYIAVSCGLPCCAHRLLYEAVQREKQRVDCSAFGSFWKAHFLHRNGDQRLFFLLCPRGKRLTSREPLKTLVEELLKRRLLRRVSSHTVQVQLVDCAVECVLCGLTSTFEISGITLKDVKNTKLCHALILAEQGSFKKPLEFLRPEKFDLLRRDFKIASQGRYLSSIHSNVIGLDDFLRFNHEREWLTAKAAMAMFQMLTFLRDASPKDSNLVSVGNDLLVLSDFARFYCTIMDLDSPSALKLLFLVLDTDMDGFIGFEDFLTFYKEKARVYAREGLILADCRVIWRHFLDLCGHKSSSSSDNDKGERGVLCWEDLLRLEAKQRSFLLKAMLLREDGVSLVDIRASLVSSTSALVTE